MQKPDMISEGVKGPDNQPMTAKLVFDMACEKLEDQEACNHFLSEGYEPFAVTPEPAPKSIVDPKQGMMIQFRIWFKRPRMVKVEKGEAK